MKTLPAKSVQTCVTSPPYYGLRDYGHDGQIGLEETPEAYVCKLVEVFREVKRVLRDDGTLWLNLGDSYAARLRQAGDEHAGSLSKSARGVITDVSRPLAMGYKEKDLYGIPWMVAFALRADGYYLRSDIIWHKPNPMPESVTDRPTKSHEYIFLLSKSREYFYDADAVREVQRGDGRKRGMHSSEYIEAAKKNGHGPGSMLAERFEDTGTRNRRSVWTVTTKPYSGAHFATFPTDLIEPCILAGTSAHGCCAKCGAPWARIMEPDERVQAHWQGTTQDKALAAKGKHGATSVIETGSYQTYKTVGWQPTCNCNADVAPCTVLDPFNGSGTTGAVALKHGRHYIGCELNPDYIELAHKRIQQSKPTLFALEMSA